MSELPLDVSLLGLLVLPCEDCTASVRTSEALERLRALASGRPFGFLLGEHRRLCRTCAAVQASLDCERELQLRAKDCERARERQHATVQRTLARCGLRVGKGMHSVAATSMRVWVDGREVVGVDYGSPSGDRTVAQWMRLARRS